MSKTFIIIVVIIAAILFAIHYFTTQKFEEMQGNTTSSETQIPETKIMDRADIPDDSEYDVQVKIGEEITPTAIFEEVITKYKSLETYQSEGTIVSNIDRGGMKMKLETSFSMKLKKPNLYLISWTQKNMPMPGMTQSGTVWNTSTQPYLYVGTGYTYFKMDNDEVALSSATGISSGAAFTIPSLFLSVLKDLPPSFSRMIDPQLEKIEKVEEEDCYVISGESTISKKETFWVSKKTYLIRKYSCSFEPPEGGLSMPEMSDEDVEQTLKAMGKEITEEKKAKLKNMMQSSKEILKSSQLKGFSTEVHSKIRFSDLTVDDFKFNLPPGTVLKESFSYELDTDQISKITEEAAKKSGIKMKTGENALKDFRKDVPIFKDAGIMIGSPIKGGNKKILVYNSNESVQTIDEFYQEELRKNGWEIKGRSITKPFGVEKTEFICEKKGVKLEVSLMKVPAFPKDQTSVTLDVTEEGSL